MDNINHLMNKDISIKGITLSVPNKLLIKESDVIIAKQRKYGLIGYNGTGKTTLLNFIKNNVKDDHDMIFVEQEAVPDKTKTVYETVLEANVERYNLIKEYNKLKILVEDDSNISDDISSDISSDISDEVINRYRIVLDKLNQIGADKDESYVRRVLYGLGFEAEDQDKPTSNFSGGWRMRVSLAKAFYMKPSLLLLDEPTNHLDLNATIWLTEYLANEWKGGIIIVSHNKNFINRVCTDIIHLYQQKLTYYTNKNINQNMNQTKLSRKEKRRLKKDKKEGKSRKNREVKQKGIYDIFYKGHQENLRILEKTWENQVMKKVREMKNRSTPKKIVKKFIEDNEYRRPPEDYKVEIEFEEPLLIKSSVITCENLSFGYTKDTDDIILSGIDLQIKMDSRYAIVGKNGAGKSTLIKLIIGELKPKGGEIITDSRLRIGYYNQHSSEVLPLNKTPIEYLQNSNSKLRDMESRKYLGKIGLSGKLHVSRIKTLSGGQKARVVLASIISTNPHLLILDEPTNHLDIETIDALIDGINNYKGGVVMVTHNIDLIEKTDSDLLEVYNGEIYNTDLDEYRNCILEEINQQ